MHTFAIGPIQHLNDEHNAMACLLELLKQEQKHLIEADIESLTKITAEKTEIIKKIAGLAEARYQALASAGCAPNDISMQTWLDEASNIGASGIWSKMIEIARSAKELNRTNGLLISQHLTRNRNALNVLQGTGNGGNFYGPNGQSTTKPSQRRLVIG